MLYVNCHYTCSEPYGIRLLNFYYKRKTQGRESSQFGQGMTRQTKNNAELKRIPLSRQRKLSHIHSHLYIRAQRLDSHTTKIHIIFTILTININHCFFESHATLCRQPTFLTLNAMSCRNLKFHFTF